MNISRPGAPDTTSQHAQPIALRRSDIRVTEVVSGLQATDWQIKHRCTFVLQESSACMPQHLRMSVYMPPLQPSAVALRSGHPPTNDLYAAAAACLSLRTRIIKQGLHTLSKIDAHGCWSQLTCCRRRCTAASALFG